MATGTAGTVARQYHTQQVHFLRKSLIETDGQSAAYTVGVIPAGSVIIKPLSGVAVTTAYTAATNKLIQIGTSGTANLYGTNLSVATLGFVALDEAVSYLVTSDTTITATHALTGTAGTAGRAEVVIAYIPDTDG